MLLNVGKQHLQTGELVNSSVDTCTVDAQFIIDQCWAGYSKHVMYYLLLVAVISK